MNRNRRRLATLLVVLLAAAAATALAAGDRPFMTSDPGAVLHGAPITARALGDTLYLLGNPADPDQSSQGGIGPQHSGTFEDASGNPAWNGWTHEDVTVDPSAYWQVSDFNAIAGQYSMWCGTTYDGDPGYGNAWNQNLVFAHQVADNATASEVVLQGTLQYDTEPGYDFVHVQVNVDGVWETLASYDGDRTESVDLSRTYQPGHYVGSGADEIQLRLRFESDGAWSDEDGLWDTDGACQWDDVTVVVNGDVVDSEDFEDQISQRWLQVLDPGVGDYAALYVDLQDLDPCRSNYSPQVAFIDDGEVVPGTGGTACITWCYGPGGWIVNNTGGLMGPDWHINNVIYSPVLEWPNGMDAADLTFGVYRHEELGDCGVWPGVFYQWNLRSINTGDPEDIWDTPFLNRNFVQYGGPDYLRQDEIVTDLLVPGRTHVQVALRVIEYGFVWCWNGTDGTPAPYFDNVQFRAYPFAGPAVATRTLDIFNDNFPAIGDIDYQDLANNAVRLDMARNVAPPENLVNMPGDSIIFDVRAVRSGTDLAELPTLHVRMKANPLFDGVRQLPDGFTQTGDIIIGWVRGDSTFTIGGAPVEDRYHFDLPDETFFFPGDELRYYVRAEDTLGGVTLLPADTSGFAPPPDDVYADLRYPADFVVRALPTMHGAYPGDQPPILFWEDAIDRGGFDEWQFALWHGGYERGVDYDVYATNAPSSAVGNGLGGRATSAQLSGYETLLYTSGTLSVKLLSNGDYESDPSDDLQVVSNWLAQGDKHAFMTGDNLVTGILNEGGMGQAFVNDYFNVSYLDRSVGLYIGDQITPRVVNEPGNGIIVTVDAWIAYGGCPAVNSFDAYETNAGAVRLAEFTEPGGNPGVYTYAAASYYQNPVDGARVVIMPYDLMFVHNAAGWEPPAGYAGIPARSIVLEDVLNLFGHFAVGQPIGVAPDAPLTVRSFPNPFNPATTIRLSLPRATDVSLRIYDLRGALVRTLVDGRLDAGVHDVAWNGTGRRGEQVASGVYFYELKAGGETRVEKLTLVK